MLSAVFISFLRLLSRFKFDVILKFKKYESEESNFFLVSVIEVFFPFNLNFKAM